MRGYSVRVHRFLVLSLILATAASSAQSPTSYPNELASLQFYDKYLKPLRPHLSGREEVVRVLGSDEGIDLSEWRIRPFFVRTDEGATVAPELVGRLAEITVTPKRRKSMASVKFPAAFSHAFGSVSETNVTCDIYADNSGLAYWIYSKNSKVGKRGDLMQIVYGPRKE